MTLHVTACKQRGAFTLDIRFDIDAPGVVALFGPSGCGKSTAIDIIAGLLPADRGRIVLDGDVLLDTALGLDVAAEQRGIGYVFQDARLFPHLNVAANLKYGLKRAVGAHFISTEEVIRLLDLEPLLHRRTHQLSGGERQRVAIGRALLAQPRLLLLDEPLAGLDRVRREEVLPYLESLRDRLAIPMVYVSHQFEEVLRLATHVVLMQSGGVVAQGSLGDISLHRHLRGFIGPDAVGAILNGEVLGEDENGMIRLRIGRGELKVHPVHATLPAARLTIGSTLRVQLLARDIIVSTRMPDHLSVRNNLDGVITRIETDDDHADLIFIDIGGTEILARVTKAATRELSLAAGTPAWALVKSVSLRAIPISRASPRA
jgi:molybdate transport system ATP-binding protein